MENTSNDKIETLIFNFDEFTPFSEENSNPLSSFILKNTNKERSLICDSEFVGELFNGSIAETNDTNKFTKKKKKIIEHDNSIKKDKNSIENNEKNKSNNKNKKKCKKNKYSTENLPRKVKNLALDLILNFFNKKIKEIYNNELGNYINRKELLRINQEHKQKMNRNYNESLLDKTMEKIFSVNISGKYTNYPLTFNKELINSLLNEKDEEKKIRLNSLFNKTFRQCIRHLRGDEIIDGLEGLEKEYIEYIKRKFNVLEENEDEKIYKSKFFETFNNFENIFNKKEKKK
jgi:hypothetical protein